MPPDETAAHLLRHRLQLTGFIRALVRDAHAAEDIFQDTCVRALREAGSFSDPVHALRWFRRAAKNKAIDLLRQRRRQGEACFDEATAELLAGAAESAKSADWPGNADADAAAAGQDRLRALKACLGTLAPHARRVLDLRYAESLPGIAVARRLNRKVDAIYKSLARTYQHLRGCIRERLREGGAA